MYQNITRKPGMVQGLSRKLWLVMRLTTVILLATFMQVSALSLAQKITLSAADAPLKTVLKDIKAQSGYLFLYSDRALELSHPVSVHVQELALEEVLEKIFAAQPLQYSVNGNTITISERLSDFFKSSASLITVLRVSGKVTDTEGEALPGVNVIEKGTSNGAVTDIDGNYSLDVNNDATLVFSFIGYKTKEVAVNGRSVVDIAIEEDVTALNELVVTGYQTLSQERITGAFSVATEKELGTRISTNIVDRLEGLFTGVAVDKDNNITIRGTGTLYGNKKPLIVVDGFPTEDDLNTINPDNVKTITVLKDASAASIWGTRAANGVIVITTKDGGNTNGMEVEASYYRTTSMKQDYKDLQLMSGEQSIDMTLYFLDDFLDGYQWAFYDNRSIYVESPEQYENIPIPTLLTLWNRHHTLSDDHEYKLSEAEYNAEIERLKNTDGFKQYSDLLLRNAQQDQYNLTLRSVSDNNNFVGSMVFNNDQTTAVGTESQRLILNLKNRFDLSERISYEMGINLAYNENANNGMGASYFLSNPQYVPLIDENGDKVYTYQENFMARPLHDSLGLNYNYNPIDEVENSDNTSKGMSTRLQTGVDFKIIDGLTVSSKFQYERSFTKNRNLQTPELPSWRKMLNDFYYDGEYHIPYGGRLNVANNSLTAWTIRNQLNFNKSYNNEKHIITAIAGTEARKVTFEGSRSEIIGYNEQTALGATFDTQAITDGDIRTRWGGRVWGFYSFPSVSRSDGREISYYGNLSYSFNEKYNITGSVRADKASIFGVAKTNRVNTLWSAGTSWNIEKENFFQVSWIDRLSLRATYGSNGNRPQANFTAYLTGIVRNFSYRGPDNTNTIVLSTPENKDLQSEKVYTLNTGLDFSVFSGAIRGSVDYYSKVSKDLLGPNALPVTTGWLSNIINYASMKNTGIEIALNSTPVRVGDFRWDVGANFSYNKNEITDLQVELNYSQNVLNPVASSYSTFVGLPIAGYPYDRLFAYRWAGLNAEGMPLVLGNEGDSLTWSQDRAYPVDENPKYQGTTVAPYYGALRNTFEYKNFILGVVFTYKLGHKMRAPLGDSNPYYEADGGGNLHKSYANFWREPGDEELTNVPGWGADPDEAWWGHYYQPYYRNADINVADASHVRLKDISLEYRIPRHLLSKVGIQAASLKFQAQNVWLWAANDWGIDPEAINNNTLSFPIPKSFVFGVKVNL